MFSLDTFLLLYGKSIFTFILANKLSIAFIYVILDKLAQKTKTTVDDRILTFLHNLFLRITGKGFMVDDLYNDCLKNNLLASPKLKVITKVKNKKQVLNETTNS